MSSQAAEEIRSGISQEAGLDHVGTLPREGQMILPLTSARFFAALMVVFFHTLFQSSPRFEIGYSLHRIFAYGQSAVPFFFVLSGYILARVYPVIEDWAAVRKFLVARFARIYPLFIVCMLVDVPRVAMNRIAKYGLALGISFTGASFLLQASMLTAVVPDVTPIDRASWSIPVEFTFYLAFPWLISLKVWRLPKSGLQWGVIFTVLFGWVLAPPLFVYLCFDVVPDRLTYFIERNPIFRISEFIIGICLARLTYCEFNRARGLTKAALLLGVTGCCSVVYFCSFGFAPMRSAVMIPFFALMIPGLANSGGAIVKLLSLPWLVLLGEASYALYLIHLPLWDIVRPLGADTHLVLYLAYVASSIVISIALYFGIEKPCRAYLRKRFV